MTTTRHDTTVSDMLDIDQSLSQAICTMTRGDLLPDETLDFICRMIDGCSVESIIDGSIKYINTGDTYNGTIIYTARDDGYYVMTLGDLLESYCILAADKIYGGCRAQRIARQYPDHVTRILGAADLMQALRAGPPDETTASETEISEYDNLVDELIDSQDVIIGEGGDLYLWIADIPRDYRLND